MAKMRLDRKKAFGDCEGPLGFPMRSDVAKYVEGVLADLPANCRELVKDGPMRVAKVAAGIDFKDDERADVSFITTDSVDRDFEVMLPGGGDFRQFRKNPVVTFAHNYNALPVGRSLWLKREQKAKLDGWLAKTAYIDRPEGWEGGWFPDAVWHMVRSKVLPGKSIGFLPLDLGPPDEKDLKKHPEWAGVNYVIRKWLALEYAVAPVQANPDALVIETAKAIKKGIEIPETMLEAMGVILPSEIPGLAFLQEDEPELKQPDEETVRKAVTATEAKDALARGVEGLVGSINIEAIVNGTVDRLRGRV